MAERSLRVSRPGRTDTSRVSSSPVLAEDRTGHHAVDQACPFCGARFARREHLKRHIKRHTNEKPFDCTDCGKSFARKDVLARHIVSHKSMNLVGTGSRACNQCASSRVRCSRVVPCARCTQRGLPCRFPDPPSGPSLELLETSHARVNSTSGDPELLLGLAQELPSDTDPRQAPQRIIVPGPGEPPPPELISGQPTPTHNRELDEDTHGTSSALIEPSQRTTQRVISQDDRQGLPTFLQGDTSDAVMNCLSTNWISPLYSYSGTVDSADQWMSLDLYPTGASFEMGLGFDAGVWPGEVDTVSENTPPAPASRQRHISPPESFPMATPGISSRCSEGSVQDAASSAYPASETASIDPPSKDRYYVNGSGARAAFLESPTSTNFARTESLHDDEAPAQVVSKLGVAGRISPQCYDMLRVEMQQRCNSMGVEIDWLTVPPLSQMKHLVSFYFDKLHTSFPFFPEAFFVTGSDSDWILVLAVAALSAMDRPEGLMPGAETVLPSLLRTLVESQIHDRVRGHDEERQWLSWVSLPGPRNDTRELYMVQAAILNILCMLRSDDQSLIPSALAERSRLVHICMSMDLLSEGGGSWAEGPMSTTDRQMEREARIKSGMMIWLLDAIFGYLFQAHRLLRIRDMQTPLFLAQRTNGIYSDLSLMEALEILHVEKRLPCEFDDLSTTILIYAACRNLDDMHDAEGVKLWKWMPTSQVQKRRSTEHVNHMWPPSSLLLSKWRNSTCDCLDILHWRANSRVAAAAGWEHVNILHLHLARLAILTPMSHIQRLAGIASVQSRVDTTSYYQIVGDERTAGTRACVLRWVSRDQHKARLAVVHAGALLWHVRRFGCGNLVAPFAAFAATLTLWAYSHCFQLCVTGNSSTPCSQAQGHHITTRDDSAQTPGSARPSSSSPEPTLIQIDRPCDDEMVQTFVRMGNAMSVHVQGVGDLHMPEAPIKVVEVGLRLITSTSGGPVLLPSSQPRPHHGGLHGSVLEKSYATLLKDVICRSSEKV